MFEGFGVNIVEGMINGIGSMIGALRDQVMGMAGNIAGWVQDAMGSALDSLSSGANRAIQLGKDTAAGLGQGIRDGANRATESAANLANDVTSTVRGWLDIHSPAACLPPLVTTSPKAWPTALKPTPMAPLNKCAASPAICVTPPPG